MAQNSDRETLAVLTRSAKGGLIAIDGAAAALGLSRLEASRKLGALTRSGWLSRVRRGLYTVRPLEAMPGAALAEEDPWVVAMALFAPCYIGGWTAATHWHLTEQLFRTTFVVTSRRLRRRDVTVGATTFRVARKPWRESRLIRPVWRGDAQALVSSVERTIVDACTYPDWIGGGRSLAAAFETAVTDRLMTEDALLHAAHESDSGAALGRLGLLTERLFPDAERVVKFAAEKRGTGYVRLDPAIRRNGTLATRWGVWINVNLATAAT